LCRFSCLRNFLFGSLLCCWFLFGSVVFFAAGFFLGAFFVATVFFAEDFFSEVFLTVAFLGADFFPSVTFLDATCALDNSVDIHDAQTN